MTKMIVRPGEQDRKRDLVRRLLALRAFDERDHAIEERFARIRADAHDDAVGEHARAAGDRERSPPASRMTGADSPVIADSSTVAAPSTISPSAAISSFASATIAVAAAQLRRGDALLATVDQPARDVSRLRAAQKLGLRLAAAFGDRLGEVGEQDREPQPDRDRDVEADACRRRARRGTRRRATTSAPTSTMNMTGLRSCTRGSSFTNESRIAGPRIARSNSERVNAMTIRIVFPCSSEQMFDDRPSASAGKNVSAPTMTITPISSTTKIGEVVANVPAVAGTLALAGERAGEREHRHR